MRVWSHSYGDLVAPFDMKSILDLPSCEFINTETEIRWPSLMDSLLKRREITSGRITPLFGC